MKKKGCRDFDVAIGKDIESFWSMCGARFDGFLRRKRTTREGD